MPVSTSQVEAAYVTLSGSGNQSYTGLTALPTFLELTVSQEGVGTDAITSFTTGWADGTNQRTDTTYGDTSGGMTAKFTNQILTVYRRVSGTITKVFEASLVSFDNNGGGDYGFTLNQTTSTQSFQTSVKAYS